MPIDRQALITDAPRGHSPAARIERLTRERDVLAEMLTAVAFDRHVQALHNYDFDVCDDWLCKDARAAIAAVEGETPKTGDGSGG